MDYNDAGTLFTTGSSAQVAVWDGHTGELISTARLPEGEGQSSAGFRPDGTLIVAAYSGRVFSWDPSIDHAVAFACRVAGRDLTREEWSAEFPDRPFRSTCPA